MKNLIIIDFKKKKVLSTKILTRVELCKIDTRILEISDTLEQCSDSDDDVRDNLQSELEFLLDILVESQASAEYKEKFGVAK